MQHVPPAGHVLKDEGEHLLSFIPGREELDGLLDLRTDDRPDEHGETESQFSVLRHWPFEPEPEPSSIPLTPCAKRRKVVECRLIRSLPECGG